MNAENIRKYLPHITVAVIVLYFGYNMYPRYSRAGDFNYRDFGKIPVYDGGRYKPIDTVARSTLMILTHRQSYYDVDTGARYSATKWMLDVMTSPPPRDPALVALCENGGQNQPAWDHKIFRIENDEVLRLLKLPMREGLRYSFAEIANNPQWPAFVKEFERVRRMDPKKHTLFDAKIAELGEHLQLMLQLSAHGAPLVIPNPDGSDQWRPFHDALNRFGGSAEGLPKGADAETYAYYHDLLKHYDQRDPNRFNETLAKFMTYLQSQGRMGNIGLEIFFNDFAPFYHCLVLYAIIALMVGASWILSASPWSQPLRRAAYAAMALVFVVHLSGMVMRMILQDRMFVFVTNLYSSAVFIGMGCVLVCLIAEWFYGNGIAIKVGAATGFSTLIIAHMLSLSGDTMIMMQAVLDTNFWLATHVTCVTLGYTMAFVAGFMGIAYIGLGLFTDMLRKEGSANLARMTYGVLCAGMFLSFVGTVLGGLWADYSWGRFWGWDPKENGALLIVIWIALILHARWGGLVKHRGIAVLSVLGIIITSWSWFGTNFLGVGLHAYGGAKGGAMAALILIDLGFLAIAGAGCVPLHHWQSFRPLSSLPPVPPAGPIPPTGITAKPKLA